MRFVSARFSFCLIAVSLLPLFLSRGAFGQTTTQDPAPLGVELIAPPVDPRGAVLFFDDSGTLFELTEARTHLRHVKLDLPDGRRCSDFRKDEFAGGAECVEETVLIRGPVVVDLLTGQSVPDLSQVRIPAISYERVDFRIDDGDPDDGLLEPDDELVDRSLVARANFEFMDVQAELVLSLKFNEDVRLEAPGGVEVGPDLVVEFDAAQWLEGVSIGECLENGDLDIEDGRLIVDDDARKGDCSQIEEDIKENIKRSGRLIESR